MKRSTLGYAILAFSIILVGIGIRNFPKGENPIFSPGRVDIGEIVKKLAKQERSSYSYRYYIIFNEQPIFQIEKSMWSDFTGDEKFGYIPKKAWKHFSWPEEVTPGKEKENHQEITPTTTAIITAPLISEELSSEIESASLKWKGWDTMWGPKKSQ